MAAPRPDQTVLDRAQNPWRARSICCARKRRDRRRRGGESDAAFLDRLAHLRHAEGERRGFFRADLAAGPFDDEIRTRSSSRCSSSSRSSSAPLRAPRRISSRRAPNTDGVGTSGFLNFAMSQAMAEPSRLTAAKAM